MKPLHQGIIYTLPAVFTKEVEPYWVCLPMATRTALSSYEMFWYPWDDRKESSWVRPMPKRPYVINLKNNPMTTYRYRTRI